MPERGTPARPRTDAPTEAVHPRTRDLDQLPTDALLARILDEDAGVAHAVRATLPELGRACERLVEALRAGGRWFNLGAGTSGRLGVLDAAEIPPTFGLDPSRVQGLIAGGEAALRQAVEGAEDDSSAAARDLDARGFGPGDVLVALSASGQTPYVLGATRHAHALGATRIGITCNPDSPLARDADIALVANVGPEVLTGSTRLKGGLAQQMLLHTLSTAVMVRLGHVRGNLMTGLRAQNQKLRTRALAILTELTGCTAAEATEALNTANGSVAKALSLLENP